MRGVGATSLLGGLLMAASVAAQSAPPPPLCEFAQADGAHIFDIEVYQPGVIGFSTGESAWWANCNDRAALRLPNYRSRDLAGYLRIDALFVQIVTGPEAVTMKAAGARMRAAGYDVVDERLAPDACVCKPEVLVFARPYSRGSK